MKLLSCCWGRSHPHPDWMLFTETLQIGPKVSLQEQIDEKENFGFSSEERAWVVQVAGYLLLQKLFAGGQKSFGGLKLEV